MGMTQRIPGAVFDTGPPALIMVAWRGVERLHNGHAAQVDGPGRHDDAPDRVGAIECRIVIFWGGRPLVLHRCNFALICRMRFEVHLPAKSLKLFGGSKTAGIAND